MSTRTSHRHYHLFKPRKPLTAAGSWHWTGADCVPSAETIVESTPASMPWTGADCVPSAETIVEGGPASMEWTGADSVPVVTLPPDVPKPRFLIRMDTPAGVKYFATVESAAFLTPYEGRLVKPPVIARRMRDNFWGVQDPQPIDFEVAVGDGYLPADAPETLRGRWITVDRWDETFLTYAVEWSGVVSRAELDGVRRGLRIYGTSLDTSVLETMVPTRLVDTATWPKAVDVGAVVPWVRGYAPKVRLPYVREDFLTNTYDYLLGHAPVSLVAAYRNGPNGSLHEIGFAECLNASGNPASSWANACRTDLYDGFVVIRMPVAQLDFQNNRHEIRADLKGVSNPTSEPDRNFITAIRLMLESTAYGVGKSVNVSSLATAAAAMNPAVTKLYCDGALTEQVQLRFLLDHLTMPRGIRLGTAPDTAQWTFEIDTAQSAIVSTLGDGTGDGPRNLVKCGPRSAPDINDAVSRVVLKYRLDRLTDTLLFPQSRTLQLIGKERTLENPFILEHETADRVTDFIGKRLHNAQTRVPVVVGQDGKTWREGQLVSVTYAPLGLSARTMEIESLEKGLVEIKADLRGWNADAYTYAAGTLPADQAIGTFADLTRVAPAAPTALAVDASVLEATGNTWTVKVTFRFTVPSVNYAQAILRYRKNGTLVWAPVAPTTDTGTVKVTVPGLPQDQVTDVSVVAISPYGVASAASATLTFTTERDTTAPTAPSDLTVRQAGGKSVEIAVTHVRPSDWGQIEVYRATNVSFTGEVLVDKGAKSVFHDQGVEYDLTYYYRALSRDTGGNANGYSPTRSLLIRRIRENDVDNSQITPPKIPPGAITGLLTANAPGGVTTTSTAGVTIPSAAITVTLEPDDVGVELTVNTVLVASNSTNPGVNPTTPGASGPIGAVLILYRNGIELRRTTCFFSHSQPGWTLQAPAMISGTDLASGLPETRIYTLRIARHPIAIANSVAVAGLGPGQGVANSVLMQAARRRR